MVDIFLSCFKIMADQCLVGAMHGAAPTRCCKRNGSLIGAHGMRPRVAASHLYTYLNQCSLGLALAVAVFVQEQASAQDQAQRRTGSSYCFSCQMKRGEQSIPLLSLPESMERNRSLLNKSLGGISGSSFQTEEATPEQVLRQQVKVPPEPRFGTGLSSYESDHLTESSFADNRSLFKSFEQNFRTPSYFKADESFQPTPSTSLELLGGRHKRGLLKDIVPVLEKTH